MFHNFFHASSWKSKRHWHTVFLACRRNKTNDLICRRIILRSADNSSERQTTSGKFLSVRYSKSSLARKAPSIIWQLVVYIYLFVDDSDGKDSIRFLWMVSYANGLANILKYVARYLILYHICIRLFDELHFEMR